MFAGVAAGRTTLRVLDCGCGTGHNLRTLGQYGRSFGLDLSEGGLALARDVGPAPGAGRHRDACRLPLTRSTS